MSRVAQEAAVHRARDAHVAETALLLELALLLERARVREHALLHAAHEHDRELESLHSVERDQGGGRRRFLPFVLIRHERDLLEERRQLLIERQRDELLGDAAQLHHVGVSFFSFLGPIL